jgi:hypothetical protein
VHPVGDAVPKRRARQPVYSALLRLLPQKKIISTLTYWARVEQNAPVLILCWDAGPKSEGRESKVADPNAAFGYRMYAKARLDPPNHPGRQFASEGIGTEKLGSLRRAMEKHRVALAALRQEYRYTYNLLNTPDVRSVDVADAMQRLIDLTAEDNDVIEWLDEQGIEYGRCGTWIDMNDEDDAFHFRMRWT